MNSVHLHSHPESYVLHEVASQWPQLTGSDQEPETIAKRLEWWLGHGPGGTGTVALYRDGDEVQGVAAYRPKLLNTPRGVSLVGEIGHTMTAPAARGRGVFSKLVATLIEHAQSSGLAGLYGTPNRASGDIYINRLGFTPIWRWRRHIKAINRLHSNHLTSTIHNVSRNRRRDFAVARVPVEEVSPLEARVPELVRDRDYLSWRYPSPAYEAWEVSDRRGALAWVVTGSTTRLGKPSISLADYAFRPDAGLFEMRRAFLGVVAEAASVRPSSQWVFAMSRPGSHFGRGLAISGFLGRQSNAPIIAAAFNDEFLQEMFDLAFRAGDSDTV